VESTKVSIIKTAKHIRTEIEWLQDFLFSFVE